MTAVADLTQKEIDELLEGNDGNGVENVPIELDEDLILDEEPIENTTKMNTKDSEEPEKLTIDEENNSVESLIPDTILAGPSYVDSTTDSAFNNNFPHETTNSKEQPNREEEITILDSDDEGGKPVVNISRRRRKQPIYMKERNLARQIVINSVASVDGKPYGPSQTCIRNSYAKLFEYQKKRMDKELENIQEMIKLNTVRLYELREEKRARLAVQKQMLELQKQLDSITKELASNSYKKPIPQPINGQPLEFQQPQQRPPHHSHQQQPQPLQLQQQQQPPQLQPRQVIIHPYTPQAASAQFAMNSHNHPTPMNNSSSMRKRSSDHFVMMNEPRKTFRIEYPVMANPREPLNQHATYPNIVQNELTDMNKPGRAYGHSLAPTREYENQPFQLEPDKKCNGNRELVCIVPKIPTECLSFQAYKPLPTKPTFFNQFNSVDVSVNIKSSKEDFFENWQIAGTVEYPNCSNVDQSKIELFVQIHSLKPLGLDGIIRQTDEKIDWACSHLHNCSASHKTKFRIKFHRDQDIPTNDRISIFASLDDGSRIYVSAISTLVYS